ncbi:MAG: hypothetical protein IPN76_14720 [Saprospiraceae bacterium]|nr:hypothetical protein [Saprospiraceae bacterium]
MDTSFFNEIFSIFTATEVRHFRQFVASPYFNGRPQLVPLLDYFIKTKHVEEAPTQEKAFSAAFPSEKFDDQKWRLTLSQLYKLAELFLAQQELETETNFPKLRTAQAYRKRNLPKHFQRMVAALQKEQNTIAQQDANSIEDHYQLEWERYRFLSSGKRTEEFNLQGTSDLMDMAFIARKLRHACFALSHQAVYRTEYKLGLLEAVLEHVAMDVRLQDHPAIGLYYHCYLMLTNVGGEAQFERFKAMLFEKGHLLPDEERRNLFLLAINYGIRQINASRPEYDRPVLDLYKMALEGNLLLEEGRLSRFAFNNIVAVALRIGEVDWVERFILENKNNLDREHRNITASLNLARLEFARKNHREALLHLQRSDFKDLINNLIAKTLQLKIYYETGEYEVLEAHLRNMKTYIRRQRAIGYHQENYLNIIKFTQSLVDMNPFDRTEREALRSNIEKAGRLTEREWLLEMLNE